MQVRVHVHVYMCTCLPLVVLLLDVRVGLRRKVGVLRLGLGPLAALERVELQALHQGRVRRCHVVVGEGRPLIVHHRPLVVLLGDSLPLLGARGKVRVGLLVLLLGLRYGGAAQLLRQSRVRSSHLGAAASGEKCVVRSAW